MRVSVLIPTFQRPHAVARCVGLLAPQVRNIGEVLVGLDGPDPVAENALAKSWRDAGGEASRLHVVTCDKGGQARVRNRLLSLAQGRTLLFLNDDMIPQPGLVSEHLVAQRACEAEGAPAAIAGASPWLVHAPDPLFARMIRETSMVFFHHRMEADPDPSRDWGFRHAWLLNLSLPASQVRAVGGFAEFPCTYGYEDDDLAWRLQQRFGTRVLYRPRAAALHDHPMTPRDYLRREYRLGFAARGFAAASPACAKAMFGRDVLAAQEIANCGTRVEQDGPLVAAWTSDFEQLHRRPASDAACAEIPALYERHLPLKRWTWRKGLLDAAASTLRARNVSQAEVFGRPAIAVAPRPR